MKNWKKLLKDNFCLLLLIGIVLSFFYPVIWQRKIPIPADTIVGMYHPWRDKIWDNFTAGVPYKNFLVTDPVRQQYIWRNLAIEQLKSGELPLWNPYSFSGSPLLANFQSAPFYPLNFLFFVLPFNFAWTILVILQPLLAGIFLYLYLRFFKVSQLGSMIGGFTFAFSGFSIAWLEWNTIIQTVMWLPLILLVKEKLLQKMTLKWVIILIFAEVSAFLAGHLQLLFYTLIISNVYLLVRIIQLSIGHQNKENIFVVSFKKYLPFLFIGAAVLLITSAQWLPTLQFILQSSRDFDQGSWMSVGWFIPWQHLIQFIAPDFFGNPATGNYWGVWNYGEFVGFIGIAPLILALYSLFSIRNKKILFFGGFLIFSALFAFPTPLAKLPFILKIPFISTSQPTRLLFIIDFALCILAAFGFDQFIKDGKTKKIILLLTVFSMLAVILWFIFIIFYPFIENNEYLNIAKRNLILPTILVILNAIIFILISRTKGITQYLGRIALLTILIFELFRFGWKFTPFTKEEWIFPDTKIINNLKQDKDNYRFMAVDRRIMPPNFATAYKIADVSGYDPLYLQGYNELVAAWDRNKPDISPASFNRIITPQNYESFIADLLGVKYIMSFGPLQSDKLEYLSSEGDTYLYANKNVFPRAFLVENVLKTATNQEMIAKMYELMDKLKNTAVVTDDVNITANKLQNDEIAEITYYGSNKISIQVATNDERMLVLTDIYYPTWKALVDGRETKIYQVDFVLRAVIVPAGTHKIEFKNNLL